MAEPGIDYRALQFWVLVVQLVGNVIAWIAGWWSLRRKATADEIKDISRQLQTLRTDHSDRLQALQKEQGKNCGQHLTRTTTLEAQMEAQAKSALTHADLGAVYDRINVVKGSVDEMIGALKGISAQVGLLVKHHMGESK